MNKQRAEQILASARAIQTSLAEVETALDTDRLQVGDFQFIDRSLRAQTREVDSLIRYLEEMLGDSMRIDS